jgi:protein SCO1/2
MKRLNVFMVVMALFAASGIKAQTAVPVPAPEVGIDDKVGAQIPLQTQFYDERGYLVSLQDVITKPTILNFVYFKCPGLCSPILTELTSIVNKMDMQIGQDYQIVTISFDETEKPELAASKKENYMALLNGNIPDPA